MATTLTASAADLANNTAKLERKTDIDSQRIRDTFVDAVAGIRSQGHKTEVERAEIAAAQDTARRGAEKLKADYHDNPSRLFTDARVALFGKAPRQAAERMSRRQASRIARSFDTDDAAAEALQDASADGDGEGDLVRAIASVGFDKSPQAGLS